MTCDDARDIDVSEVTDAAQAVAMALHCERQIQPAPTQALREYWIRAADYWWGKA